MQKPKWDSLEEWEKFLAEDTDFPDIINKSEIIWEEEDNLDILENQKKKIWEILDWEYKIEDIKDDLDIDFNVDSNWFWLLKLSYLWNLLWVIEFRINWDKAYTDFTGSINAKLLEIKEEDLYEMFREYFWEEEKNIKVKGLLYFLHLELIKGLKKQWIKTIIRATKKESIFYISNKLEEEGIIKYWKEEELDNWLKQLIIEI